MKAVRANCTMRAAGIAPDWRAISVPAWNRASVGMLRIPKR
jgi:hypothetical protein